MTLRSVMVQLSADQIERLDRVAAKSGVSRSQLVRDAIDEALTPAIDADVAARYAAAYPDGGDALDEGGDEWGDLDRWHAAAAAAGTADERDPW